MRNFQKRKSPPPVEGVWQIQEAKAKFSELIDTVLRDGSQRISKHGEEVAVILSKEAFDKLSRPSDSLLHFFKNAPCQEVELDLTREKDTPREFLL
jgi:prevent-host-death family protein